MSRYPTSASRLPELHVHVPYANVWNFGLRNLATLAVVTYFIILLGR